MPSLHWIGKDKVINHHLEVPYRLLKKGYSFGEENSGNKIIRGDNLEALKALLPEYEGKIKCIYIDPPYNTGNEGWVYNDNVTDPKIKKWLGDVVGKDGEDLTRHDKWLCMMYPRLKLLHRLLSDDGAIFISIDDNEQSNLKLAMDEIFGGNNFITSVTWFKKVSPSNDAKWFSNDHEYLMIFAKNKTNWFPKKLPLSEKQKGYYSNPDNDLRGPWNSSTYTCNKTADERPNLYYPLINPNTGIEVWPKKTAVWAYGKDQSEKHIAENLIYWGVDGNAKMPRFKKFLSGSKGVVPRTIWHYDDFGHTQEATQVLRQVMGDVFFTTPKPPRLIEQILKLSTDKDSIVLDSFAGSGTTGHAVLNLNKQDGGARKFILVEMEEYAESITAERVKRVIKGYGEKEGTGGGFDFYDLGPALLTSDGLLNENATVEEISAYICYTETALPLPTTKAVDHRYWLTRTEDRDHYFHYERESMTILDRGFLASITVKMPYYTIWADQCHLSESVMKKHGITFRKIPRDIRNI